jgi:hypothetical protein
MRVQCEYLERRRSGRNTVFTDVDVLANRDPAEVFAEDFDIGLTYRVEAKDAPFNGGVILAAAGDGAERFFRRTLDCYASLAASPEVAPLFADDLRAWWGDQFALFASVGQPAFCTRASEGVSVDGVKVAFFPCEHYNYTPRDGSELTRSALSAKPFLHFKGNRKAWAAVYAGQLGA